MKIKLIIPALLFSTQIYGSVTEKLAVNSGRISSLKQSIKSGKFDAEMKCRDCTKRCKDGRF